MVMMALTPILLDEKCVDAKKGDQRMLFINVNKAIMELGEKEQVVQDELKNALETALEKRGREIFCYISTLCDRIITASLVISCTIS